MRKTILIFTLIIQSAIVYAQSYRTGIGIRVGTDVGITIQQKAIENFTIEGILQSNRERYSISILPEIHHNIISKRINFYGGVGAHFGEEFDKGKFYGASPILGIEMTFARFNVSYDYKPQVNISTGSNLVFHNTGLSIRYVIVKQKKKKFFDFLFKKKDKS